MRIKNFISIACMVPLAFFMACAQELENVSGISGADEKGVLICLAPEGMGLIETRAEGTPADSRIENVIIYACDPETGNVLRSYQQELDDPDKEVRMILPQQAVDLYAVCNSNDLSTDLGNISELQGKLVEIEQLGDAFNGSMIMYGTKSLTEADVQNKTVPQTIRVKRIAAKITFTVKFAPEVQGDQFYLTQIRAYNVPARTYIVEREQTSIYAAAEGDAVHLASGQTDNAGYYLQDCLLTPEESIDGNTVDFYLFENRRGGIDTSTDEGKNKFTAIYPDENNWQFLKGNIGRDEYPYATYVNIEGNYLSADGLSQKAVYTIYLGTNEYSDFNVFRNCHYVVTSTIKSCNVIDTRVDAKIMNDAELTGSFNNPLDAHCNAVRCFGYTRNPEGWEIYVDEPDEHPWLEISFSSQYCPRIAGKSYDDDRMVAASRMEGSGQLTSYFYIHTDEYIPENPNANESLNNATDEKSWRTGYVILRDKANGTSDTIEVKQRPAQVVKMPITNLLGDITGYNEYFVEYELEQKNITWGFLKYGANPVMTGMINDRWDGLSNTRKLYQEAVKIDESNPDYEGEDAGIYWGAYNGYLTVEDGPYPHLTNMKDIIDRIPDDHMIKYVLGKNRDRNGNGYIDYDEIVWYVPALDELAELWRVLDEKHIAFQNSGDRFHSSTPYLAGYTDEVPGRAFYVKNNGETGFAMRDRQYNVICCRRKGAWTGNNDAALGGNVTTDDKWDDAETDILPKQ